MIIKLSEPLLTQCVYIYIYIIIANLAVEDVAAQHCPK